MNRCYEWLSRSNEASSTFILLFLRAWTSEVLPGTWEDVAPAELLEDLVATGAVYMEDEGDLNTSTSNQRVSHIPVLLFDHWTTVYTPLCQLDVVQSGTTGILLFSALNTGLLRKGKYSESRKNFDTQRVFFLQFSLLRLECFEARAERWISSSNTSSGHSPDDPDWNTGCRHVLTAWETLRLILSFRRFSSSSPLSQSGWRGRFQRSRALQVRSWINI